MTHMQTADVATLSFQQRNWSIGKSPIFVVFYSSSILGHGASGKYQRTVHLINLDLQSRGERKYEALKVFIGAK